MPQSASQPISEMLTAILDTPFSVISNEAVTILNNLHFIRDDWFFAFIPLVIYLYLYSKKTKNNKNWQSVIDQKLLPFVLTKKGDGKRKRYPLVLTFIAASLCITALAGPVYKKLPQPVYREQSSLVVLLDLSASMNATDIKPSRLARAKLKLLDILKTRTTGQTALIVYAADAFVVTPLTNDNATIANLVPTLETNMMPAQGSNLSIALAKAFSLFNQAGIIKGDILVITDGINEKNEYAIKKVSSQGHRLSILSVGTTEGAPIPLIDSASGGFLLDKKGGIVIPKVHPEKLQRYALTGNGIYTELKASNDDVNRLTRLFQAKEVIAQNKQDKNQNEDATADIWREEGYWLLLPLLLLAAVWARKGWIAVMLPFVVSFVVAVPQPAYADSNDTSSMNTNPMNTSPMTTTDNSTDTTKQPYFDTDNLWSSPDQKAMKAFTAGDNKSAAEHFSHPDWKASALYRNGDYQGTVDVLENTESSDGYYNKANALAKLGRYPESIKAYDRALELDPQNEDAKFNREQVKHALEQQQSEEQKSDQQQSDEQKQDENSQDKDNQSQDQDSKDQNSEDQSNQDKQDQSESDSQQQDGDKQDSNNQEQNQQGQQDKESSEKDDEQNQQPTDSEQQQAEEQELKQRDAEAEKKQQQEEQEKYDQQQQEQKDQQQQSDSVENKDDESDSTEKDPLEIEVNPTEASITEEEKATEQWLKRIPDDPGGLLRRKFLYQYKRAPNQTDSDEPW